MEERPKLILSTAIMGQLNPEQWKELVGFTERVLRREGLSYGVSLEVVAVVKEPLLALLMRRIKAVGLAEKIEVIHGRVDYDQAAFEGRLKLIKGVKRLELVAYDLFMAWVGESYRATLRFPQAKLLLHSSTLFQLAVMTGGKPRLWRQRLVVENDEKIVFPFGDEKLAAKMRRWGNALNPADVLRFAQKRKLAKMAFDTAHFWRCFPEKEERERIWKEFKRLAERGRVPIYWHMNHDNGEHFEIKKSPPSSASRRTTARRGHDEWLAQVCKFIGPRVRGGEDQICLEEPRRVALKLSKKGMAEVAAGVERSIKSLREFGGL